MGVILAVPASMIIQLFRKYPGSFYTDSFTPNSLVSHNAALSEEQLQQIDKNTSSHPNNNPTIQLLVSHYGKLTANFVQHTGISIPRVLGCDICYYY